jgi:hypothetical protein
MAVRLRTQAAIQEIKSRLDPDTQRHAICDLIERLGIEYANPFDKAFTGDRAQLKCVGAGFLAEAVLLREGDLEEPGRRSESRLPPGDRHYDVDR